MRGSLIVALLLTLEPACEVPRCSPSNCAGCCDPLGRCVTGNTPQACGYFGTGCFLCNPNSSCVDGFCRDGGRLLVPGDFGVAGGGGGGGGLFFFGGGVGGGRAGGGATGGGSVADGGAGSCVDDRSCGAGSVCHARLKRCVTACAANGLRCTAPLSACRDARGQPVSGSDAGYCQCSTDAECNLARLGDLCQGSQACGPACAADADCFQGSRCDGLTGRCSFPSDAGSGCVFTASRSSNTTCEFEVTCPAGGPYALTCTGTFSCSCRNGAMTRTVPTSGSPCSVVEPSTLFSTCSIPRP